MMSETNNHIRNKRFLVTGGCGFVGSHLCHSLMSSGASVVVLDDLSTGRIENIELLEPLETFEFIHSKVSDFSSLNEVIASCDHVIHLAAAVGVDLVVKSPVNTIKTNLVETECVLEACSVDKTPLLLASTSEVYGKSSAEEFDEEDDLIIGPPRYGRWSYACSKLMDEFLCLSYAKEKGLPVRIVRLFNTVGPKQTGQFGMVLPRFVEAALNNKPIHVYGGGLQSRCFCHVFDTVEAIQRLVLTDASLGEIVNIGNTQEMTILQLAERVISQLDSKSEIKHVSYEEAYAEGFQDMQRRKPSIKKLINLTGYSPQFSIDHIIQDTADFLKENTS